MLIDFDSLPPEIEAAHGALVAALAARDGLASRITETAGAASEAGRAAEAADAAVLAAERNLALGDANNRPALVKAIDKAVATAADRAEQSEMLGRERRGLLGLVAETDAALVAAANAWAEVAAPFRIAIRGMVHEHFIAAAEPLVRALRLGYAVASALPGLEIGAALDGVVVPRFRPPNGPIFTHIVKRGCLWTTDDNRAGDDLLVSDRDPETLALCALLEPLVTAEQTAAPIVQRITSSPSWRAERAQRERPVEPPPMTAEERALENHRQKWGEAVAVVTGIHPSWGRRWAPPLKPGGSADAGGGETDGRRA